MKIIWAIIWSLFIATFISMLKGLTITDAKKNKLIKEGVKRGQEVKAKLIKSKTIRREINNSGVDEYLDKGIYEYEFNGKKYRTKVYERQGYLKDELDIVHTKNLGKLYRSTKIYWFKYFLISLLIMLLFIF